MPVQEQVLTHAFGGQDLYVQSQTGTGKTAAFLIVIFERLLTESNLSGKKALIMAPTRELAVQIEEEAKVLARYLPFKIGSFYGGVGYGEQQRLLRDNVQLLVGTPGRVLDLNGSGQMNLMDLAFLVLDEADRMFDMGFYPDLRKLIRVVPPADRRQTMLFSATLNAWVKNLAWEYTKNPFEIEIEPQTVTVEEIEQYLYHVPSGDKLRLLLGIFEREQPESALVFCNTKRYAEIVAKRLRLNGYDCEFIMGDLPQSKRLKVIDDVKAGKTRFLVATDVAARGLDIEGLSMVVNYDLPNESENYVHRIGRTARAGKTGKAITLSSEQDVYELPAIERYIGKKIPSEIAREDLYGEDKSAGVRIRSEFFGDASSRTRRDDAGPRRAARDDRGGSGRRDSREGGASSGARRERTGSAGRGAAGGAPAGAASDNRRGSARDGERRGGRNRAPLAGSALREESALRQESIPRGAGGESGALADAAGIAPVNAAAHDAEKLLNLSFDERMAYYKQKYTGDAPDGNTPTGASAGEAGGRKRRSRNGGGGANAPAGGAAARDRAAGSGGGTGAGPDGPRGRSRRRGKSGGASAGAGSAGGAPTSGGAPRSGAAVPGGGKTAGAPARGPAAAPEKKGVIARILGIFKK
jgi:ATP-dependent RNA helicase RhlB